MWRRRLADWGGKALFWKLRREAAALDGAPRLDIGFRRGQNHGDQVLRGFIQINVLPRPR